MLDKKNKYFWQLGFGFSLLLNCFLIYHLIDNGITTSYREQDINRCNREKDDAVKVLNWMIKNNLDFDPISAKQAFPQIPNILYKVDDKGYTILGELCFNKEQMHWSVQYCDKVYNKNLH